MIIYIKYMVLPPEGICMCTCVWVWFLVIVLTSEFLWTVSRQIVLGRGKTKLLGSIFMVSQIPQTHGSALASSFCISIIKRADYKVVFLLLMFC